MIKEKVIKEKVIKEKVIKDGTTNQHPPSLTSINRKAATATDEAKWVTFGS